MLSLSGQLKLDNRLLIPFSENERLRAFRPRDGMGSSLVRVLRFVKLKLPIIPLSLSLTGLLLRDQINISCFLEDIVVTPKAFLIPLELDELCPSKNTSPSKYCIYFCESYCPSESLSVSFFNRFPLLDKFFALS